MVPQDGRCSTARSPTTSATGRPGATDDDLDLAFLELGLADWVEELPRGLHTRRRARRRLSAGERQLVALARAYVANPDLLVLDEATSAVDPATEVRLQRALAGLTSGGPRSPSPTGCRPPRQADEVLVFDQGRVVERGPHDELVARRRRLRRPAPSWVAGTGSPLTATERNAVFRRAGRRRTLALRPATRTDEERAVTTTSTSSRHPGDPEADADPATTIEQLDAAVATCSSTRGRGPRLDVERGSRCSRSCIEDTLAAAPAWALRRRRGQGHRAATRR
jgi:hypothetical protein